MLLWFALQLPTGRQVVTTDRTRPVTMGLPRFSSAALQLALLLLAVDIFRGGGGAGGERAKRLSDQSNGQQIEVAISVR